MNLSNFMKNNCQHSKGAKVFFFGLGIVVLALLIFQAGVFVGYHKASFSYRLGDNYSRMFGGGTRGMMGGRGFGQEDFLNGHGTVGQVVKISLPTLIVSDRDKTEKVILIDSQTIIRSFRDSIKIDQLKVGDSVMVIGTPNDQSQIVAKLVRLIPTLPSGRTLSASTTSAN